MTNRPQPASLTATAAIAAALALSATPAFAQDAAPVVIDAAPVVAPPAAPAPVAAPVAPPARIELPSDLTTPIGGQASTPSNATTAPETARPSAAPTRAAGQPRNAAQPARAVRTATAPVTAPTPSSTPVASPAPMDADLAPVSAVPVTTPAAPAPMAQAPVADTTAQMPADDSGNALAIAAILAGLVGIGAAGTLAMRRRYRGAIRDDSPVYEPVASEAELPAAAAMAVPVTPIEPEIVPVREYAATDADGTAAGWAVAQEDVDLPLAPATASDRSFAMPEGPVPTGAARQALLDRMVAAEPDAANPFRSVPARRKRARIILQAREHAQREDATLPFDFRTYRPSTERAVMSESVEA